MSFEAKVYKILIASPADVPDERNAIAEVISNWNNINSEQKKVVLMPVGWETHSAPLLGNRPQGIINEQIVNGCDMLIGVFWTRLGSPTGVSDSGTVEEIEHFIKAGKPVMLYFSGRKVDITTLDLSQLEKLRDFQKNMQKIGLIGSYVDINDFKEQLRNQISINVNNLLTNTLISIPTPEERTQKVKSIEKIMKKDKIYMEDYKKDGEIKSFLVKGDTVEIKNEIKELGGKWNNTLKGWIFPKSKEIEIAEFLKNYLSTK
ncbi:hypothetical protein [uncultured Haemophilus sp.]|uniref:hypothetical protein n=1 Tax=uncultured Haemophilus sp. TaxID=237779 RepID=UPI0025DAB4E0|nr:hypothetical protein [uncultured Haemophilus sp.]